MTEVMSWSYFKEILTNELKIGLEMLEDGNIDQATIHFQNALTLISGSREMLSVILGDVQ